jgi:hypothetical protein
MLQYIYPRNRTIRPGMRSWSYLTSPWFPQADPSNKRAQTFSAWLSHRRVVLLLACTAATLIFLVNLISSIVIYKTVNEGRLFHGKCTTANIVSSTSHIVINILSSLLLGASNLCMQLLSAPTREEVDAAHKERKWLDIRILIVRNLRHIARHRVFALVVLALLSLPLHFL